MAINISFGDYDTVCYSNQHNIMELIKNSVGISVEINFTQEQVSDVSDQLDQVKQELEDTESETSGKLNTLVTQVNQLQRDLDQLRREYDLFSYAVNADLKSLDDRITALGG